MAWGASCAGIPGRGPAGVDGTADVVGPGAVVVVPGAVSGVAADVGAVVAGWERGGLEEATERLAPADPVQPPATSKPAATMARRRGAGIGGNAKGCVSSRPGAPHMLGRSRLRAQHLGSRARPVKIVTLPS